jgi:hypothetical protein
MRPVLAVLMLACVVQAQTSLNIVAIQGDGTFNSIKGKTGQSPVVEVRDDQGNPVTSATVRFVLPMDGPSAKFADGSLTAESTTDDHGRASAPALVPNSTEGRFNIKVTATSGSRQGSLIMAQTNTLAEAGGHSNKKVLIILLLAGAAGVGAALALHGGSKSSGTGVSAPPPVVVSIGGVTVGGPQ